MITHIFESVLDTDVCTFLVSQNRAAICGEPYRAHFLPLPSDPPVRSDYERALERIKELEGDLASSEEERLRAKEDAGNLRLRLDESLAREGALNQRLSNLNILAREITEHVEKMSSALDKPASTT